MTAAANSAVYNADVDEMTAGALATLAEVRSLIAQRPDTDPVRIIDEYAADMVRDAIDEDETDEA